MAIVETLEVRFAAKLGNLGVQIAALTGALGKLGWASSTAALGIAGASLAARKALNGANLSVAQAEKSHARFASRLKKTSRAFKNVSGAAKQAAEGIGLHRMDEINLVGEQEKQKSGGSRGVRSGGSGAAHDGLKKLKAALEQSAGFFERFYGNIRRNMKGVDGWIDRATGGLASKMIKLLASAGKNAADSLKDGLLERLNLCKPELTLKGGGLLQAVGEALRSGAANSSLPAQAGSLLVGKMAGRLLGGKPLVKSAASSVTASATFGSEAAKTEAQNAGLDLSKGFAGGMLSYTEKIRSAAQKLASAALSKLKSLLKIASPSKLTYAMGGYFGEGFANGISACADMARGSAEHLSMSAANVLAEARPIGLGEASLSGMVRAAVDEALGGANIVIPLSVDGMKLGEASIRGINRVTRASGRLMLEM